MDQTAVVKELQDDGRRLIAALTAAGFEVRAAGWVETENDNRPYLYIVTSHVNDGSTRANYGRVDAVMRRLPPLRVSLLDVKLIPTFDPLAEAMTRYHDRYVADPCDSVIHSDYFFGVSVQRPVFLYAPTAPAPAGG